MFTAMEAVFSIGQLPSSAWISTFTGEESKFDEKPIRRAAVMHSVPLLTTVPAARAAALAIERLQKSQLTVKALQDYHAELTLE